MELAQVIIRPIVTEKAYTEQEKSKYMFRVNTKANKIEVKQAIEKYYGIKPLSVNITMMKPKERIIGRGTVMQKRKAFKRAIVTLPKGKSIDVTKLTKEKKKK